MLEATLDKRHNKPGSHTIKKLTFLANIKYSVNLYCMNILKINQKTSKIK